MQTDVIFRVTRLQKFNLYRWIPFSATEEIAIAYFLLENLLTRLLKPDEQNKETQVQKVLQF